MNSIADELNKLLEKDRNKKENVEDKTIEKEGDETKDINEEKEEKKGDETKDINEVFKTAVSRSAADVIKELTVENWSVGKKSQREACKRMMELANSDENISNVFLRKVDDSTSVIGEEVMKRFKVDNKEDKKTVKEKNSKKADFKDKKNSKRKEDDIAKVEIDDSEVKEGDGMLGLSKYFMAAVE